jgi:hypothetical protein
MSDFLIFLKSSTTKTPKTRYSCLLAPVDILVSLTLSQMKRKHSTAVKGQGDSIAKAPAEKKQRILDEKPTFLSLPRELRQKILLQTVDETQLDVKQHYNFDEFPYNWFEAFDQHKKAVDKWAKVLKKVDQNIKEDVDFAVRKWKENYDDCFDVLMYDYEHLLYNPEDPDIMDNASLCIW